MQFKRTLPMPSREKSPMLQWIFGVIRFWFSSYSSKKRTTKRMLETIYFYFKLPWDWEVGKAEVILVAEMEEKVCFASYKTLYSTLFCPVPNHNHGCSRSDDIFLVFDLQNSFIKQVVSTSMFRRFFRLLKKLTKRIKSVGRKKHSLDDMSLISSHHSLMALE